MSSLLCELCFCKLCRLNLTVIEEHIEVGACQVVERLNNNGKRLAMGMRDGELLSRG